MGMMLTGFFVVLLNGFKKKTNRTPKREIEKAVKLKTDYFNEERD